VDIEVPCASREYNKVHVLQSLILGGRAARI
jgi:hypothetical protein